MDRGALGPGTAFPPSDTYLFLVFFLILSLPPRSFCLSVLCACSCFFNFPAGRLWQRAGASAKPSCDASSQARPLSVDGGPHEGNRGCTVCVRGCSATQCCSRRRTCLVRVFAAGARRCVAGGSAAARSISRRDIRLDSHNSAPSIAQVLKLETHGTFSV
jgi:hypothetical protein